MGITGLLTDVFESIMRERYIVRHGRRLMSMNIMEMCDNFQGLLWNIYEQTHFLIETSSFVKEISLKSDENDCIKSFICHIRFFFFIDKYGTKSDIRKWYSGGTRGMAFPRANN